MTRNCKYITKDCKYITRDCKYITWDCKYIKGDNKNAAQQKAILYHCSANLYEVAFAQQNQYYLHKNTLAHPWGRT